MYVEPIPLRHLVNGSNDLLSKWSALHKTLAIILQKVAVVFTTATPSYEKRAEELAIFSTPVKKTFPHWATSPHSQIPSVGCLYFYWWGA